MVQMRSPVETESLYEQDYQLWLEKTAKQLKNRDLEDLDYDNLIEEIESMGRSDKHALASNLRVILLHLLKYKYQPKKRSKSWRVSIYQHRLRIQDSLQTSPSLKRFYREIFDKSYRESRHLASLETGLEIAKFPERSPFSPEETLDFDYLPE